jgi:hypothetical protein
MSLLSNVCDGLRHRGVTRSEDKLISGRIKHNTDTDSDYYHC